MLYRTSDPDEYLPPITLEWCITTLINLGFPRDDDYHPKDPL